MPKYDASTGEIDFSMALEVLKRGERVRRRDWGNAYIKIDKSGFYMHMPNRQKDVAWVPTWEEMLADDWIEIV